MTYDQILARVKKSEKRLQAYKKALNVAKEHERKITGQDIAALFAPLFTAVPQLVCLSWTQYTPYFMDGAPCVFSVNFPYVSMRLNRDTLLGGALCDVLALDADKCDDYFNTFSDYEDPEWYDNEVVYRSINLDAFIDDIYEKTPVQLREGLGTIKDLLCAPEELFLGLFGDHAEVTISRAKLPPGLSSGPQQDQGDQLIIVVGGVDHD